eukprot:7159701-Prorocentrum_lima.AAC.1
MCERWLGPFFGDGNQPDGTGVDMGDGLHLSLAKNSGGENGETRGASSRGPPVFGADGGPIARMDPGH